MYITRPQLLRKTIILVHRLLQRKAMLGAPVACQRLRDRGVIVFAVAYRGRWPSAGGRVRPRGSHGGSSCRFARDITDHLGQLAVICSRAFCMCCTAREAIATSILRCRK